MPSQTLSSSPLAANTDQKQRGRPFQKGVSGNPNGKKPGTRNHASRLIETMMAGDIEEITQKVINAAKSGDLIAARLVLDRICPPRKDAPIEIDLPDIKSSSDAVNVMRAIMSGVADGVITPCEAASLSGLVDSFVKSLEANEFEARIARLEQAAA